MRLFRRGPSRLDRILAAARLDEAVSRAGKARAPGQGALQAARAAIDAPGAAVTGDVRALEQVKDGLKARFPGWGVWYVRQPGRDPVWYARPWPQVTAGSADLLAAEIGRAHAEAAARWPALKPGPRDLEEAL